MRKIDNLIAAINELDAEAWTEIEKRTVDRLLYVECEGVDDRSNRVRCKTIVSNALLDIAGAP